MAVQKFEDIMAWQKEQDLAVDVYCMYKNLSSYGFKDEICRAVVSTSNNIAEGFERGFHADFSRFLYIAMGSCNEVMSMLYLAERLAYINTESKDVHIAKADEISKIVRGLIKSIKK